MASSGTVLGPFQLRRRLGTGGAGDVWRASVPGQAVDVAVKLLKADHWTDAMVGSFLDEARAAAGLDHPHLVQVLDFGLADGDEEAVPYLAMDLATGGALTDASLPWGELHVAVDQVMRGLAHAHARNVVHLDIKGDNILLGTATDARAGWRVVDFGVAFALGRTGDGRVSGTPSHMAPEQWHAHWRDFGPWTDVYALGCTVWELVSGAPIYAGGILQLALQHTTGQLPSLRPRQPVPRELGDWLARALHVQPGQRFQHMAEARAAWQALGPAEALGDVPLPRLPRAHRAAAATLSFGLAPLPTTAPRPAASAPSLRLPPEDWRQAEPPTAPLTMGVLGMGMVAARVPPLVGRDAERDALWSALCEVATTGRGRALCLGGATGTGKTRLARWLVELAHTTGSARTLVATHGPDDEVGHGLDAAARRFLRCDGASADERSQRVEAFLDELPSVDDEDAALIEAFVDPTRPSAGASARRFVQLLCGAGPVVVVLDDLQHRPDLAAMAAGFEELPILLVGTWEGEPAVQAPWVTKALAPLSTAAMRRLVEGLLPLTSVASAHLVEASAGNPQEAVQRLLAHTQRGDLQPQGDRYDVRGDELPVDDIDALWSDRLAQAARRWSEDDVVAVEVAAALGAHVDAALWASACPSPPRPDLLPELLGVGLATRAPRAVRWRFAHPRARLAVIRWAHAHGRWAGANELVLAGLPPDAHPARRGRLLLAAGQTAAAVPVLLDAVQRLRDDARLHEAAAVLARVDEGLAVLGAQSPREHSVEADIHRARLILERHLGVEAEAVARRAFAAARRIGPADRVAKAGRTLMSCHHRHGASDEAMALGAALLDELDGQLGAAQQARLLALQGLLRLFHRADQAEEQALGLREMAQAVALGGLTPAQEGDVLVYRSRVHPDDAPERLQLLQEALARYVAVGSYKGRGLCHHDLATVCLSRGDREGALRHFRASARAFDRVGANAYCNARLGEGMTLVDLGRTAEGVSVLRWVRDRARRIGHVAWGWSAAVGLFHAAVRADDVAQAEAWLREVEALSPEGLSRGEVPHDHIVAAAAACSAPALAERFATRMRAVLA